MADARDSKSRDGNIMSVRVRPSAPYFAPTELRMARPFSQMIDIEHQEKQSEVCPS